MPLRLGKKIAGLRSGQRKGQGDLGSDFIGTKTELIEIFGLTGSHFGFEGFLGK